MPVTDQACDSGHMKWEKVGSVYFSTPSPFLSFEGVRVGVCVTLLPQLFWSVWLDRSKDRATWQSSSMIFVSYLADTMWMLTTPASSSRVGFAKALSPGLERKQVLTSFVYFRPTLPSLFTPHLGFTCSVGSYMGNWQKE